MSAVYFYVSYVRSTAKRDRYIDIAVIVDELSLDYPGTLTLLWKLTRGE